MEDIWIIIALGIILTCGIGLGWLGNDLIKVPIEKCSTQARIAGLWLPNLSDLTNYDGRYICINIDETKTLTELEFYCKHEIGHEIFARECETNFTKCQEVVG